ncbi:MAG: nuclear transport factor 2 family protein [Methylocella sp.]
MAFAQELLDAGARKVYAAARNPEHITLNGAERFWSPAYIQHSAHIAPGREGLFELVKAAPKELHYENALIVADGDYVMLHGRFSGIGQPVNWVVADILRIDNGLLAEHWDVIQDEATRESSKSGRPMFGDKFPA